MLWEFMIYAQAFDDNYEFEVRHAGFKSRWHVPYPMRKMPDALRQAYEAKVYADKLSHDAFAESYAA